jgi:large subunit ribosomal protein L13
MQRKTHIINAENQILGRLAVKVAILLRGKNKPDFAPNKDGGDFVTVRNINKIRLTGRKAENKIYYHYSGYPGGLKETSLQKIFEKSPDKVLRKAVFGMLPKNKLRAKQIKRLKIE